MKVTKDELIKLLQDEVKSKMATDEFGETLKTAMSDMIKDLQNDVPSPFTGVPATKMSQLYPGSVVTEGGYMNTKQGSLLNLRNKQMPWVSLSNEMEEWTKQFASYLKTGQVTKLLSEGVDTEGGFLIPEEFRAIMVMYDAEPTIVWNRATVWPMAGEKVGFPKLVQNPDVTDAGFDHFAGVSFSWTEEGGEKGETEPNFGLVELIVHELAGYTELTNTLLDDSSINLINYLTKMFRAAWFWQTDKSFIQGAGGKQPLGIINDPSILTVNRQTAGAIEMVDVLNMEARLPAVFDPNAVWFITKQGRASLRGQTVTASSKELVLHETFKEIADGYSMTILGKPAILADGKIPTLGNTGDLIYGAWSQYYIGFRQGFSMDSSKHYKFRNNRTALRCSGRVDGQAAIPEAFVILDETS